MVRPLDHATIMQQANFADKQAQENMAHPEANRYNSAENEKLRRVEERERTIETQKTAKSIVHRKEEDQGNRKKKRRNQEKGKGKSLDIEA